MVIINTEIDQINNNFLRYLAEKSLEQDKQELNQKIKNYIKADELYNKYILALNEFLPFISFMTTTTPFEIIRKKRFELKLPEEKFKLTLKEFLAESDFKAIIDDESGDLFDKYISNNYNYFEHNRYNNLETEVLFGVMDKFSEILSTNFFNSKKTLLEFEAKIYQSTLL